MSSWLQVTYPIFVCLWLIAHFITNERGSRRSRGYYSTKTFLDDEIPFVPNMAMFYFSGFLLGNMAYILLGSTEYFPHIATGYGLQFVVSISVYAIYPCHIERRENFRPNSFLGHLLAKYQRISKPFNAFPSMHTSYCLFSALAVWGCVSHTTGLVLIVWSVMVALSTLLTKQHYVVDVLAGAILATGLYLIIL